jgi:hypothetical protein
MSFHYQRDFEDEVFDRRYRVWAHDRRLRNLGAGPGHGDVRIVHLALQRMHRRGWQFKHVLVVQQPALSTAFLA